MAKKAKQAPRKIVIQRKDVRALYAAVGRLIDHTEFGENFRGGPEAQIATIKRLVKNW